MLIRQERKCFGDKLGIFKLKDEFKSALIDISNPPLWEMIMWIVSHNMNNLILEISFDEFMQQTAYYFSQRHRSEGIKQIFDLFDYE